MGKKYVVALAHSDANLGTPGKYTPTQLRRVKDLVRKVAEGSVGGLKNIVKKGDKVFIKINTVVPSDPALGFTTDPRILEAVIELVKEQKPSEIMVGERCALGGKTLDAMKVCGITDVAARTGARLVPLEDYPFETYKINRPVSFREFPVPKPIINSDVYIGLPKMKVHIHTTLTCALKLQFGNLPDYKWMAECHRDDIYQKIVNLNHALNHYVKRKWFLVDSLYSCQGNGPFSPYPEDSIKDFNTICGGTDPTSIDTVCEALMGWDNPGNNAPATVLAAYEGIGTNKMHEIKVVGEDLKKVARKFRKQDTRLQGVFPNVNVIVGSACEPGCRVLVRMALDGLYVGGVLQKLKRPVTIITGTQFEPYIKDAAGDVIIYGDCAKNMTEYYPNAKVFFSTDEYSACAPLWSNLPRVGLVDIVKNLAG